MDQPAPALPLRDGALVNADQDILTAEVVIIGSGMGGGTLAWALKDTGLDVLIVERGQFLPREPENSQPDHVFIKKRYVTSQPWYDARTGQPFQPGAYYWVGGNTKMYGACLPRFRRSDFQEVAHHDGVSPAWPFSYDDLEPFYGQAEQLYEVHGAVVEDSKPSPKAGCRGGRRGRGRARCQDRGEDFCGVRRGGQLGSLIAAFSERLTPQRTRQFLWLAGPQLHGPQQHFLPSGQ